MKTIMLSAVFGAALVLLAGNQAQARCFVNSCSHSSFLPANAAEVDRIANSGAWLQNRDTVNYLTVVADLGVGLSSIRGPSVQMSLITGVGQSVDCYETAINIATGATFSAWTRLMGSGLINVDRLSGLPSATYGFGLICYISPGTGNLATTTKIIGYTQSTP